MKDLTRQHSISLAASIDEINEWADEHLGDFLIEGEDPLIINQELANKAMKKA